MEKKLNVSTQEFNQAKLFLNTMTNLSITYNHCIDFPEILVQQKQVTVFNIFIEYRPFKNVF